MASTIVSLVLLLSAVSAASSKLPDTPSLGEQGSSIADRGFVFNLGGSTPTISASGGMQFVADRESFPALRLPNGGGTQVLFRFAPCGFRTPHYHPRGVENFFVVKGNVRANLLREAGGRRGQQVVINDITEGFAGFFPEAHIHFLQNNGCDEAVTLSTFNTNDEGLVDVASTLRFPRDTIAQTFRNNKLAPIDAVIRDVLTQSQACLRRCKLLKRPVKPYKRYY